MTCGENEALELVLTLLVVAAAAATHTHSGMDGNCNVWI